jgi:hypothetical protein
MRDNSTCTIAEVQQHIIAEYTHWINHFKVGVGLSDPLSALFAADLVDNLDALELFGDDHATL